MSASTLTAAAAVAAPAASPSPSPSASASPSPAPAADSDDGPAAGAPIAPAQAFIPAHTRAWSAEKRAHLATYCAQHELDAITPLLPAATVPVAVAAASASAAAAAPPAEVSAALAATAAFLTTPPAADSLEARGRVIQMGDQAIVDFGRGKAWLNMDGQPNKTLRLAKQTAKVTNLAGLPYGQVWELDQRTQLLSRTDRKRGLGTALLDTNMETVKNNSQLYDTNQSQKLSQAEIEALKTPGSSTSGAALVDMLISNSATFAGKTEFSQEKYIKKKKAKHCSEVQVLPVSIARVMETFWEKDPRKMRGMRPDTMAMILSTANVKAGVNSLVVESCSGVVLGSLLYRQQGLGYVVHAFENNQKRTEGVKRFNFSAEIAGALLHVPLDKVLNKQIPIHAETAAAAAAAAPAAAPAAAVATTAAAAVSADKKADAPMDTSSNSDSASAAAPAASTASVAAAGAVPAGDMTAEEVLAQQVDVTILATRYDPYTLLQSVWPYLKVTGRFVLYDECIEPLAAAHAKLSTSSEFAAVNLVLSECFFRNHQVLPNRTHPFVNMSASGGYILSGIKMKQGK